MHGSPDDPLVEALAGTARGDREAFAALYRAAAPALMGVALKVLRRRDAAEDVLQEAFIAIWDKAGQYRPERGAPMSWMAMVVRYRAIDRLRREARRPEDAAASGDDFADVSISPETVFDSRAKDVMRCLERLAPDPQRAIWLAMREGLTHEEVSARMGRPLGTVKSWIRRGLIELKGCLES